ncbi:MAG: hypothetical protein CMH73_02700 [Nitrospina sp.]|nr:hypothetical protein [Nitrospina sp.]
MKKADLPTKICQVCQRPFSWRKKWQRVWGQVKYCSKSCTRKKNNVMLKKRNFKKDTNLRGYR